MILRWLLLTVVMETEHAGLNLVKYIRQEQGNRMTRLVLRTGQAGQAPEDIVIREYEIDDYKRENRIDDAKTKDSALLNAPFIS